MSKQMLEQENCAAKKGSCANSAAEESREAYRKPLLKKETVRGFGATAGPATRTATVETAIATM